MSELTLKNIGAALRKERGEKGLREAALEIGISPATLSRVEGGKLPDIGTFQKICKWMKVDAGVILGTKTEEPATAGAPMVHLKADRNLPENAAKALSAMIVAAYGCFNE